MKSIYRYQVEVLHDREQKLKKDGKAQEFILIDGMMTRAFCVMVISGCS
jgi:hypothetical protein